MVCIISALDVSADLTELGRTPVAVVCAGVKSILDIGRTLEVLVCILLIANRPFRCNGVSTKCRKTYVNKHVLMFSHKQTTSKHMFSCIFSI